MGEVVTSIELPVEIKRKAKSLAIELDLTFKEFVAQAMDEKINRHAKVKKNG